jgi:hypothetical protein
MRIKLAFLGLILILLLAACSGAANTPAPAGDSPTNAPAPTDLPQPTAGPTPTLPPPLAILIVPAEMNTEVSQEYQALVYDLAQSSGMRFQVLNKLTVDELALERNLKVVIAIGQDPGLAALAAAAPEAQFLAVNLPGVSASANISILGGDSTRIDQKAFIAGYIAAMITEDFHTGIILRKGSPDADVIRKAFRAGQEYFCGLCNPFAGPFLEYPLDIEVPEDAKANEYSAYADFLVVRSKVTTIFMQPGVDIPELEDYLSTVGVVMIGTQTPEKKYNTWAVTLQPNYLNAVRAVWPELVAGKGGQTFAAPLAFDDVNEEFFSPGKQLDAQRILKDLLDGLISTGVQ